jgi:hypothetical protein
MIAGIFSPNEPSRYYTRSWHPRRRIESELVQTEERKLEAASEEAATHEWELLKELTETNASRTPPYLRTSGQNCTCAIKFSVSAKSYQVRATQIPGRWSGSPVRQLDDRSRLNTMLEAKRVLGRRRARKCRYHQRTPAGFALAGVSFCRSTRLLSCISCKRLGIISCGGFCF